MLQAYKKIQVVYAVWLGNCDILDSAFLGNSAICLAILLIFSIVRNNWVKIKYHGEDKAEFQHKEKNPFTKMP